MLFEYLSYIIGTQKFHSSNGVGLGLAWGGPGLGEDIVCWSYLAQRTYIQQC